MLWRILQVLGTLAGLTWVALQVDLGTIGATAWRLPWWALVLSAAVTSTILVSMALRWQLLLRAYGAAHVPALGWLIRLTWVGFFYNTFLPGGVGGDVVRGLASRTAYGPEGLSRGMAVVFVDRVLGLMGLLVVALVASLARPVPGLVPLPLLVGVLLAGAVTGLIALALAARWQHHLPPAIRRRVPALPELGNPAAFAGAALLAPLGHLMVAVSGHLLILPLVPDLGFSTSLVVIPLAMASQLIPVTVGGTGAREAAFVALYAQVGVAAEPALAASLALFGTYLAVGAVGGLLPVAAPAESPPPP